MPHEQIGPAGPDTNRLDATMFDTVELSRLPRSVKLAAAYVDGHFSNYHQLLAMHPSLPVISIATQPTGDAMVLDVERGDATHADAVDWIRTQKMAGASRPAVYVSLSEAGALKDTLGAAGIMRSEYRLWTAHWSGVPHVCDHRCGLEGEPAGCTQYQSIPSADFDVSLTTWGWVRAVIGDGPEWRGRSGR